jgi:hypothetical protein
VRLVRVASGPLDRREPATQRPALLDPPVREGQRVRLAPRRRDPRLWARKDYVAHPARRDHKAPLDRLAPLAHRLEDPLAPPDLQDPLALRAQA